MIKLRVVVLQEAVGDGQLVWVAQALEQDMAAQAAVGEPALAAVTALGTMFDARDAIIEFEEGQSNGTHIEPLAAAPASYHEMWEDGLSIGEHALGEARTAEVRKWTA